MGVEQRSSGVLLSSVSQRYRQASVWRNGGPVGGKFLTEDPPIEGKHRQGGTVAGPPPECSEVGGDSLPARQPLGVENWPNWPAWRTARKRVHWSECSTDEYDAEGSAFRVEEVAGGFQLMTRPKFAPWLRRLHPAPGKFDCPRWPWKPWPSWPIGSPCCCGPRSRRSAACSAANSCDN